jgi:hypothetical protein
MKTNRNDPCPCGSGKKYKNCCEQKRSQSGDENRITRLLITAAVGVFLAVFLWGVIEFFATDHPEMEAYKCDNLNCGKIHYRQKTDSN